jgi:hypothetical protein
MSQGSNNKYGGWVVDVANYTLWCQNCKHSTVMGVVIQRKIHLDNSIHVKKLVYAICIN